MGRVKSLWFVEQEVNDDFEDNGLNDLIREIRAFSHELAEENDLAEEKENERQRISIR